MAALNQIAGVNLIRKDFMDHPGAPHGIVIHGGGNRQPFYAAVGRGAGDAVLIQVHRNTIFGGPLQKHPVNEPDDLRRVRINNEMVLILGVFEIPKGSKGADVLSIAPLEVKHLPDLL